MFILLRKISYFRRLRPSSSELLAIFSKALTYVTYTILFFNFKIITVKIHTSLEHLLFLHHHRKKGRHT